MMHEGLVEDGGKDMGKWAGGDWSVGQGHWQERPSIIDQ